MNTIIIGISSYTAGLLSGILFQKYFKKENEQKQGDIVLIVVTVIWALSMVIDIISPNYETSPLVHGLMGAIVGFFYRPQNKIP